MASLYKSAEGYWYLKHLDNFGKWKTKHLGKKYSKTELKAIKKKYEALELNRKFDLNLDIKGLEVADIFDAFMVELGTDPNISETTKAKYVAQSGTLKLWLKQYQIKRMEQINWTFLNTFNHYFFNIKPLHTNHARQLQYFFFRFMDWCINNGYYSNIQAIKSIKKIKRVETPPKYFTLKDLKRIFVYDSFYSIHFQFLYSTGLRISELCRLKWSDYIEENKMLMIQVPKSGKPVESIPLNRFAVDILGKLKERRGESEHIFLNSNGGELITDTIRQCFNRIKKELKIVGSLHTFRHSFASHLAIKNVSLLKIQKLMRHANIKETMIYSHLSRESLGDATEQLPEINITNQIIFPGTL